LVFVLRNTVYLQTELNGTHQLLVYADDANILGAMKKNTEAMLQACKAVKVKVKLSLCFFFNWAPRHEGVLGEWRYSSTHSL